jgi:hypothetical protein
MAEARGAASTAAFPARNLDSKQGKEVRHGSLHRIGSGAARGGASPAALASAEGITPAAFLPVGKKRRGVRECGLSRAMENGGTGGWPPSSPEGMACGRVA